MSFINQTLVLLVISAMAQCHSMPITRHVPATIKSSQCSIISGDNNSTILGFGNCQNNLYYIDIQIGTPPQTLGVQFDTGSNTLWVPTQSVRGVTPIFNTTQSSTFTNTSNPGGVQYVDGSGVSGTFGTDVFVIENSLINITTTYLWVTDMVDMSYPTGVQGLVGMGNTQIPNFLDVAYQRGEIETPVFALQIKDNTQQSYVHYNQLPEYITNDTYFEPVTSPYYWGVQITGITVGGIDMSNQAADLAVIDSGTSYFFLNPNLYQKVVENFFSNCIVIQGQPSCPCSSTANWPTFAITLRNIEVYIDPIDYTATTGIGLCTYNFGSISGISELLLGDIFMRNYIVTFDKLNYQVGFAGDKILPVDNASFTDADEIIGWILLGAVGLIILIGVLACICVEMSVSQFVQAGFTYGEFELAGRPIKQSLNS